VRLMDQSAAQLRASLVQAGNTPGPAALVALAQAHPRWPGLRHRCGCSERLPVRPVLLPIPLTTFIEQNHD